MKRLLICLLLLSSTLLAQNKTKAVIGWTYAPPAGTVACSATVTSNCILNFQVWRMAAGSSTADASKDTLLGTVPVLTNADGSWNVTAGAYSYTTPDQPFGKQTYYVLAIGATSDASNTVASVPAVGPGVVVSPFPATDVAGSPK